MRCACLGRTRCPAWSAGASGISSRSRSSRRRWRTFRRRSSRGACFSRSTRGSAPRRCKSRCASFNRAQRHPLCFHWLAYGLSAHMTVDTEAHTQPIAPDRDTRGFYVQALRTLDEKKLEYAVGGEYAMAHYTGIARNTKDLDIFIRPADRDRCLRILADAGYKTEFFYPFWISKALHGEAFIDILYNSGNGLSALDDEWFRYAEPADVHGYPTRLIPPEEQIWSKAFVQDRDRFDGGDVIHLILARGEKMDWDRLLHRFEDHERVLLAHLILFGYAYPCERDRVPAGVVERLQEQVRNEPQVDERICRGTFIAQKGYG